MIPHLRVRSEYSFKRVYGSCQQVAARLEELRCPAAGLVDVDGTWGHVAWEKALKDSRVKAMFGAEFAMETDDGKRPSCWVLATELASFYRLSSNPPKAPSDLLDAKGVIRFAGAALTDPDTFDYIDINPLSRKATRRALDLHAATGKPLVLTGLNDYPAPDDRNRFLAWNDEKRIGPQHILSQQELVERLSLLTPKQVRQAIANTHEVANRVGQLKLSVAPMISVPGDLGELVEAGRRERLERGHIKAWTPEYQARLDRELAMIKDKAYDSYFIIVAEMVQWAKERMLVGPARGSSAGSLVCYLLRITEIDPLVHGLLFERFIDVNRNDLPDIDVDFNDQKRHLVFEHLEEKYGRDNVARIGSVNRLKPRSVMAHVGKKLGIPHGSTFPVLNVLFEYSSGDSRYGNALEDTLQGTDPGREFLERFPEASLIGELEDHASHTGQHAAGIIVSNVPVTEHCTVRDGIAHIDKKDAEYLNLLKIDALGLRTLGVIEDAGVITPQELYDLPHDDQDVLAIFNDRKFSGVFQFEGGAQRRVSMQVPVRSFKQLDHITALARPGPLGGGAAGAYIERYAGNEAVTYHHPTMAEYLEETQGVVLYQEQVMRIVRELGGFSWEDTSTIRKAMSGRKGKEFFDRHGEKFVEGAALKGIGKEDALVIWNEICSFGAWGMNKSHTVSYAVISYWCAYMKTHHALEYAAACLRSAKDDEQAIEILRELRDEGVEHVAFDPQHSQLSWSVADGKVIGGFTNLHGIGPVKAAKYIAKRDASLFGLDDKDVESLLKRETKYDDLSPAHTLWGHIYDDPEAHNIHGRVRQFGELEDGDNAVVICKLVKQDRRDENETVRAARRGGQLKKGQTLFLAAFVVDDSVSKPVMVRIRPPAWERWGLPMANKAVPGQDWFLVRGRWLGQFSMLIMEKIKCLTNPEMFE